MRLFELLLWADANARMGEKLGKESPGFSVVWVIIAVAVTAILAAAAWSTCRWLLSRERGPLNSPSKLLSELCSKHGLSGRQKRLIASLARQHRLQHPGVMFVEPNLWDATEFGAFGERHSQELARLRERVFSK